MLNGFPASAAWKAIVDIIMERINKKKCNTQMSETCHCLIPLSRLPWDNGFIINQCARCGKDHGGRHQPEKEDLQKAVNREAKEIYMKFIYKE